MNESFSVTADEAVAGPQRSSTEPSRSPVSPRQKRSQRIAWLIKNRALWRGMLTARSPSDEKFQRKWREIISLMQRDGMVQPSTHWRDVNLSSLIAKARRELRGRAA